MSDTARILLLDEGVRHEVETACEPVNEWLSITPEVKGLHEGGLVLSGRFVVTHIPSGRAASQGSGCIECARHLGRVLTALDWPSAPSDMSQAAFTAWLNSHASEVVDDLSEALNLSWRCDAQDCERPLTS